MSYRSRRPRRVGGFSPLTLFTASEPGAWFDPSDLSTMFQDTGGTVPVTAAGQSVALIRDKSGRGNHATQGTAASRPLYQVVNERGCLVFDGVDDFLVTGSIVPGVDSAQLFAGVYKASDASQGILIELSSTSTNAGTFNMQAPGSSGDQFRIVSGGSLAAAAFPGVASGYAAPQTRVMTALFDISDDMAIMRLDGTQVASGSANQGTGNYNTYPLYIGRRNGTSSPLNGRLFGLVCRFGAALTADQIANAERWMASRTGVTI